MKLLVLFLLLGTLVTTGGCFRRIHPPPLPKPPRLPGTAIVIQPLNESNYLGR